MKSKAIPPFTLTAGQRGRILFDFTLPEGAEVPTLRGAVKANGRKVSMTAVDGGLMIPVLPAGVYLAEVRAGSACVLYGHVEVLPSPLFDEEGETVYKVNADLTTDVLRVSVNLAVGTPGASCYEIAVANGFEGTEEEWLNTLKGDAGKSAYELACDAGYEGTEAEWLDSLNGEPGENTGLTQEDVEALLTSAYEEASLGTPAGTDNATCNYIILDPARVPDGLLTQISYKVGTSTGTGMTTTPLYCAVWELQEGTSSTYNFVGISSNTVTQSINATCTWVFERLPLHGRALKLIPTTDSENTEVASVNLRIRTSGSTDGTLCYNNGSAKRFTPRMDVSYLRAVARFASPTDLNGHVNDAGKHITADERTEWNNTAANLTEHTNDTASHVSTAQASILSAFEWDSVRGISIIHTTDGAVDNRLRVMLSATGANLVTSGSLTLQAAQIGMSTRTAFQAWTDSSTGTSYNYGGHTMSETEMAPYGITEPCVWCGDPTLPLLLRGSEIRINSNVIDVGTLTQLLTNANALLALIDPIDG